MNKVDEGPTLYHRIEIGCDFMMVLICIVPHLDSALIANWLYQLFAGKRKTVVYTLPLGLSDMRSTLS